MLSRSLLVVRPVAAQTAKVDLCRVLCVGQYLATWIWCSEKEAVVEAMILLAHTCQTEAEESPSVVV
jgi:hypothetical protein